MKKLIICSILLFCAFVFGKDVTYRLPTYVKPSLYEIQLSTNLDEGSFEGEVFIHMDVNQLIEKIILHSNNLTIESIFLDHNNDNIGFELVPKYEFLHIFHMDNSYISPGEHTLHIRFRGSTLNKTSGFYQTQYDETLEGVSANTLWVTDFEPTSARLAFPCFDEPSFKARFSLQLTVPNATYTALFNMPPTDIFDTNRGRTFAFQTTCVMSSYILAFAVTQYPYEELVIEYNNRQLPIRIYSLNASGGNYSQALVYVAMALKYYKNYTQIAYDLPKLDFIEYSRMTVATENWGLITIDPGFLTLSPSRAFNESLILNVIAHEVGHSWFGNLVTNNWWNDIWLQEGFATYFALKVNEFFLKNYSFKDFTSDLFTDPYSDLFNKKIVRSVNTPTQITTHFSDVVYQKGSDLMRMIEMILGEERFRNVIREYLMRFAYKTATSNQFINIVEKFDINNNMRSFIESYLYQDNFPIIRIEENDENYLLYQFACCVNETKLANNPFRYKWTIPITYTTDLEEYKLIWFPRHLDALVIPKNKASWIKINYKQYGFYRTIYSESVFTQITDHLENIDNVVRNDIFDEIVYLYSLDLIPCKMAFKYLDKLLSLTNVVNSNSLFLFNLNMFKTISAYDTDTFAVLKNYFLTVFKITEHDTPSFWLRKYNATKNDEDFPQTLKMCAKWIKENLSNYI